MKKVKIISFIGLVLFGAFLFVFGGYDDSPGAQGLGLVFVFVGLYRIRKITKFKKIS